MVLPVVHWQKFKGTVLHHPAKDCVDAVLELVAEGNCTFCIDMLSLFPSATYKHRMNGMRNDYSPLLPLAESHEILHFRYHQFPLLLPQLHNADFSEKGTPTLL